MRRRTIALAALLLIILGTASACWWDRGHLAPGHIPGPARGPIHR